VKLQLPRHIVSSPHLLASFVAGIEVVDPFFFKWREWTTNSILRLAGEKAHFLKIGPELGIDDCERGPIASLGDAICLPILLLSDTGQSGSAC
jgi:hypothetical protein